MPNNMLRSRSIPLLVTYAIRLAKNAARQTLQFQSLSITGCLLQLRHECPASHEMAAATDFLRLRPTSFRGAAGIYSLLQGTQIHGIT